MTVEQRAIWQIAGGQASRPYADVFLKYGVGLIGPGDAGAWKPERDDDEFDLPAAPPACAGDPHADRGAAQAGGGFVRRFASEVQVGDVFVLRTGISTLCAVGIVASEYLYLNQFDDVSGWDLQHARRVRWCKLPQEHTFTTPVFGANPTRCSRTWNEEVVDYADRFLNSPPTNWQTAALPELPPEEPPLEDVPTTLQGLVAAANDLVPLLWDQQAFGEHPSEDEMVAHFVVPFLRALGWPPERIAVKWPCLPAGRGYIDVAVLRALPRTPENCHLVIEAKRLGAGVEGALEQAKGYVEALGAYRPACRDAGCGAGRDVVVTDGIRYRMYSCLPAAPPACAGDPHADRGAAQAGQSTFEPIAYANLGRLKKSAAELFARMKRP